MDPKGSEAYFDVLAQSVGLDYCMPPLFGAVFFKAFFSTYILVYEMKAI